MAYIQSSAMQLSFNGITNEELFPNRGVLQEDPISLYLFVLCIERQAHLIQCHVEAGYWRPIRVGGSEVHVPLLVFADDLLLFLEASDDQVQLVNSVLMDFYSMSGLKVSHAKTNVYFSKNTPHSGQQDLARTMGFSNVTNLSKYLGVPVVHSCVTNLTYENILEKADARIASYKANTLSLAGSLVLMQSVISSLSFYTMQTVWLPNGTCVGLKKHCRNFLWGGFTSNRKIHLVSWDKICQPKEYGRLALKSSVK
ncbi:RNA-directed DNA polymerase (reverse transcriptase)-related family protein [Striga hermonthica]|uniref:RNA-directed DNA polymerase (Reverse transcriptase)-related family protein n=1 Tax=Striga hermonthica TaxID=68872 RepID=A0A9N7NP16_STRHE|nr:RNA-directed DNA polymerase (reverse transcriptase)-related family protein [Striga hermonthica]